MQSGCFVAALSHPSAVHVFMLPPGMAKAPKPGEVGGLLAVGSYSGCGLVFTRPWGLVTLCW